MPPPMVSCFICSDVVTKRSTLGCLIKETGALVRVCRNHPWTIKRLEERDAEIARNKEEREINRKRAIDETVKRLRLVHTMRGISIEALMRQIEYGGLITPDMVREIREQLVEKGELSLREIAAPLFAG